MKRLLAIDAYCALCMVAAGVCADDWPQWTGPNRGGVGSETD